jgi:hypothetical protein
VKVAFGANSTVPGCQVKRPVLATRAVLWLSIMRKGTFETGTYPYPEIIIINFPISPGDMVDIWSWVNQAA